MLNMFRLYLDMFSQTGSVIKQYMLCLYFAMVNQYCVDSTVNIDILCLYFIFPSAPFHLYHVTLYMSLSCFVHALSTHQCQQRKVLACKPADWRVEISLEWLPTTCYSVKQLWKHCGEDLSLIRLTRLHSVDFPTAMSVFPSHRCKD